jgi:hypothetical protein
MPFPRSGLSHRALGIVGDSYEVGRHELILDARTVWTWDGSADDLIQYVSASHDWSAGMAVGYVSALHRARLWNRPDRDW